VGVSVFDEAQVRDVLFGADGVLAAGRDDLTVVVISTINPAAVRDIGEQVAARGARIVDAGVTPGFALPAGEAVSFVGGAAEDVERARPLLSSYSSHVLHVGPLGTGMTAKIARNVATYCIWRAMYEAARIAETGGVALAQLLEGIGVGDSRSAGRPGGAAGIVLDRRGTSAEAGEHDPQLEWLRFLNSTMKKDLVAADEFARGLDLDLPVLGYTSRHTAETIGLPEHLQTDRY
jgi:3-hydroxyisobutyrate dehydrogenase-like beta-hydroxyacid dehydrogenase